MNKEKNMIINTFILSLGIVLPKLLMIIMLPIYTVYLTKAEYGLYDFILTLLTLIIPIATLQIQSSTFRFLLDTNNLLEKKQIISSSFRTINLLSIISLLIMLFIPYEVTSIKYLIITYFILNIYFQYFLETTRGLNNNKIYSTASLINSILIVILSIILLCLFKLGLLGAILAITIAIFISNIYLVIKIKFHQYYSYKYIDKVLIKEMIKYSSPLIPNSLSWWIVNVSDRIIITYFLGIEANAIYSVSNKIPSVYSLFYSSFNLSWQESASISIKEDDQNYYSNVFTNLLKLLFGGFLLLLAVIPFVFNLLVSKSYQASYYQIPLLCTGLFFSSFANFFGGLYVATKQTKKLGISTMIAALINIIINLLLIKQIGLYAASISTVIAYLIICIYRYIDLKHKINITFNLSKILIGIIITALCIYSYYQTNLNIRLLILLITITFFIILNKKLIKIIYKRRKKENEIKN